MSWGAPVAAALLAFTLPAAQAQAAAAPDPAGFSATGLQRLGDFLRRATAPGAYLGAVSLIARDGRIVDWQAHGHRDLARTQAMPRDAIFRIYSMSKPIATVALLMLVEEGRLALDEPIARHLPEFAGLRVDTGEATLRAPARPIQLRHLLTHTAGFALGAGAPPAAARALDAADPAGAASLREYAERVARAPLGADPGTRFAYDGVNTEVACRLLEVIAQQPFDRFVQERILEPLRMVDTGFQVPAAQRHRVVELTTMGPDARLQRADAAPDGTPLKPYPSGAGGLYSTAADYARFAQMLANGGTLDGVRLLGRKTVELAMQNHLAALTPPTVPDLPGEGFGLGGTVLLDPAQRGRLGSVGQFGWIGSATTWFTVDRQERLVALLLMQHQPRSDRPDLPRPYATFQNLVYQALEK